MISVETHGVPRLELPPEAGERLREAFGACPRAAEDLEGLLARLVRAAAHLPPEVVEALLAMRAAPGGPAALLISGMPIDQVVPPTPDRAVPEPFAAGQVSEASILLVAILLGEPVAYAGEKGGALVQDVFPTRAQAETPSNESSAVSLDFHTELVFSRGAPEQSFDVAAPDHVLLLGLRAPPGRAAVTALVEARDLCARLDPDAVARLREPSFQLRAPHSFTRGGDGDRPWSRPLALVGGSEEAPRVAFDIACGARALAPEAEAALGALREACADPALQHAVELGPADLLAIDNGRCAHARSSYDARFDGEDRWLRRAYVRRDLRGLKTAGAASFRVLA